jgi:hypothetical protein
MKRTAALLTAALTVILSFSLALTASASTERKAPMPTQLDKVTEALVAHGLLVETPNTASSPRPAGSPDFLYSVADPSHDTVYSLTARLAFASPEADFPRLPAGALVIGASVYMTEAFDSGDANRITFTSSIRNGTDFAVCQDATVVGGGQVDGIPGAGLGTEFVPVYAEGEQTIVAFYDAGAGSPDTGEAIVQISYVLVQ